MSHGIRFVAHEHAAARRAIEFGVLLAIIKCVANDALNALTGIDVFLDRDFIGSSLLEDSARIGVDALRVLADHNKIHVLGLNAFQRTERFVQQTHRAHVRVKVHLEAHAEQDLFGMDVGLDSGITEGSGHDRIEIARQHGEAIGRNGRAVAEIAVGAPIELAHLDVGSRCLDDLESLWDNLLANPVTGDDGDTFPGRLLLVHGRKATTRRAE
jgi:hypothetical protein